MTPRIPWGTFEKWSPTAFLVAGGVMVLFWALVALEVFMDVSSPQALLAMPALIATFVGFLGLVPELTDHSPLMARAGAGVLAIATVGLLVIFVWVLAGRILPVATGMDVPAQPPRLFIWLTVGGYVTTVVLFGVASLWTAVPSRSVGLLILTLVGVFAIPVVAGILWGGYPGEWMAVVVSGLQAATMLAIGYALRLEFTPTDHTEPATDSPV